MVRMRRFILSLTLGLSTMACGSGAGDTELGTTVQMSTEIPQQGTCEAKGVVKLANVAGFSELDDDVRLDSRAASHIVAARPIADLPALDGVKWVGETALRRLTGYASDHGYFVACDDAGLPAPGSCEALAMRTVANTATFAELDDDVGLDRRAASNIVAARPINSLPELDSVRYVGPSALEKILAYAEEQGLLAVCHGAGPEIGIVSDLDKTVVPPADPDLSKAPYPGVTRLYQILELQNDGSWGDMFYVTARQPEMVTEIPDYLETHGVPGGPIETGVSGLPWVAEPEKVADVSSVLDANPGQMFLLFGDSSHRDPEVYKTIRETYPERIVAGFIHKVNNTVAPHRVEGLHLHNGYVEVAALLYGYQVLTRAEAEDVMVSAQAEGDPISAAAIAQLLDDHAP